MIEFTSVSHHIQKHIIDVLMFTSVARFRDLRPERTDTNLFTYHLNLLVRGGLVDKVEGGYRLSTAGLSYVDRVSTEKQTVRSQPKIVTMLLIQNGDGDVLLQKRTKQPYIDTWTLPYGKLHIEDPSVEIAAQREAFEKLGLQSQVVTHAGECYIRVHIDGGLLSTTLVHLFRFNTDNIKTSDTIEWFQPHKLAKLHLAPAVEQIVARGFFHDDSFFEEYDVHWKNDY